MISYVYCPAAAPAGLFFAISNNCRLFFLFKPYPHESPLSFFDCCRRFRPPSHSLPPKPHRRSRKGRTSARTLSAHPVPLLFLSKSTQDMSLFGIFRAKVTRPWEPTKGAYPKGIALSELYRQPSSFSPAKARQKGGIPENFLRAPLFGSPRATY